MRHGDMKGTGGGRAFHITSGSLPGPPASLDDATIRIWICILLFFSVLSLTTYSYSYSTSYSATNDRRAG